ncbi:MAG: PIN domain-containing protein [Acidobacteriota bacterium]
MKQVVLFDTGPLVAFINARDKYHEWAKAQLAEIRPPLWTCEAVLSEACFLLRETPRGPAAVLELLERGLVEVPFHIGMDPRAVRNLLARYASVPMSLADACLVRMSEAHTGSTVFTLDGDFRIYRRSGRQVIPLRIPDDL